MAAERYAKLEFEATPGSESNPAPVLFATPFFLPAIECGFTPVPNTLDRSDEQRGVDGAMTRAQNEYAPEGGANIRGYAKYLGAILMLLFGDVTTTVGDGIITDPDMATIPAGAFKHVFKKKPGAIPKTARFTLGYATKWIRAHGASCNSLAFTLEDDGMKSEAGMMANYIQRLSVDPAAVPAYEDFAVLPFRRRNVVVTVGDGGTVNLDTIQYTMEQTLEYVRDLGSRSGWPSDTERANSPEGFLRLTGSLTRRDLDAADWDALIAATTFALLVSAKSEQMIPTTGYPYSMWTSAPQAQFISGGPERLKNQARHESSYDWVAGTDAAGVDDFTVTLVNDVPAYK